MAKGYIRIMCRDIEGFSRYGKIGNLTLLRNIISPSAKISLNISCCITRLSVLSRDILCDVVIRVAECFRLPKNAGYNCVCVGNGVW